MNSNRGQGVRRPATKFPHLQKKLRKQQVQALVRKPKTRGK
jgi:hypothetical protein